MNFSDFVKTRFKGQYNHLNELQLKVLDLVSEETKESNIIFIFDGKKACPYRIIQHLFFEFIREYPDYYKTIGGSP